MDCGCFSTTAFLWRLAAYQLLFRAKRAPDFVRNQAHVIINCIFVNRSGSLSGNVLQIFRIERLTLIIPILRSIRLSAIKKLSGEAII